MAEPGAWKDGDRARKLKAEQETLEKVLAQRLAEWEEASHRLEAGVPA
jgi:hypothetical protein